MGRGHHSSGVCHEFYRYQRHGRSDRSEEHTSELQSRLHLVCRLLLEKKKTYSTSNSPAGISTMHASGDRNRASRPPSSTEPSEPTRDLLTADPHSRITQVTSTTAIA